MFLIGPSRAASGAIVGVKALAVTLGARLSEFHLGENDEVNRYDDYESPRTHSLGSECLSG
jgi:hypothetical protein